ncbi:MAG: DUF3291 domain-containing protein [Polyangiales bacterium]
MTAYHLAQYNTARILAELDDPKMRGFVDNLDRINALADKAPGFVWRVQTERGHSVDLRPYPDKKILITLSVWESVAAVRHFTYAAAGEHAGMLRQRDQWFEHPEGEYIALWWIPAGTLPTVPQAVERLEHLRQFGPTPYVFNFKKTFAPPSDTPSPSTRTAGAVL